MGALLSFLAWLTGRTKEHPPLDETHLSEKFAPQDGLTLYDHGASPAARRVRVAVIHRQIPFCTTEVNIMKGEQKSQAYRRINPNGKVPAIAIADVQGVPDCTLYESNVITEYLDTVFPDSDQLYPREPWENTQVRMWQDWELTLWEDFYPVVQSNLLGFVLRARYASLNKLIKAYPPNIPESELQSKISCFLGDHDEIELEGHAVECYRKLLFLERHLQGRTYLVGEHLTIADVSVYPRVAMHTIVGLQMPPHVFPNITRYLSHLRRHTPAFDQSEARSGQVASFLLKHLSWLMVFLGNWRSGREHRRLDTSSVLKRVMGEANSIPVQPKLVGVGDEEVVLYDSPTTSECWLMKLLLLEKGQRFRIEKRDFVEAIRRPNGSGGLFRIQHGDRVVTGSRAIVHYLDAMCGTDSLLPSDPLLRAQCQCWQAWEQTMYAIDMAKYFEMDTVSQMLHKRFPEDNLDGLLGLRSQPAFNPRFPYMMKLFVASVEEGTSLWDVMPDDYRCLQPDIDDVEDLMLNTHTALHLRLQQLDAALKDQTYLVGNTMTLADLCVFSRLLLMPYVRHKISIQKYPNVVMWLRRLRSKPNFKEIDEKFNKTFSKLLD